MQRDQRNMEDVAKGGDDHGADALRYGINHVYKPRKGVKPAASDGGRLIEQIIAEKPGSRYS